MEKIIAYTDGGARGNPGPAGVGIQIVNEQGDVIKEVSEFIGNATNNFAEYLAVATALSTLKSHFGKKTKEMAFELRMDSELVKKQLNGEYQIKEPGLVPLFIEIHNLRVANFPNLTLTHVRREQNKEADRLANEAMDNA
ncbi:ribonuclease HI family protein [Candidatus Kaiserbacteria bacterium]|nr:ribonuclease HI family protein [Candidatus Kaiserbacteria bacterium]MCB9811442.1 ribonuclease HI family protein [Candidatus Nomurabacteria bacterium]